MQQRISKTGLNEAGMLHKKIAADKAIELLNAGHLLSARFNGTAHDLWIPSAPVSCNCPYSWKGGNDKDATLLNEKEAREVINSHTWIIDPY